MEEFFFNRFRSKSNKELQHIVDNKHDYQPEAVNAAVVLLAERAHSPGSMPSKHPEKEPRNEKNYFERYDKSFSIKPFVGTLSYREILTSFSLALLFIAYSELLLYCLDESYVEWLYKPLRIIGFAGAVLGNHFLYKLEHGISNNFMGRSLHDLIFIIILVVSKITYNYIAYSTYSYSFKAGTIIIVALALVLVITIFLIELAIALLKRMLKFLKWQVL